MSIYCHTPGLLLVDQLYVQGACKPGYIYISVCSIVLHFFDKYLYMSMSHTKLSYPVLFTHILYIIQCSKCLVVFLIVQFLQSHNFHVFAFPPTQFWHIHCSPLSFCQRSDIVTQSTLFISSPHCLSVHSLIADSYCSLTISPFP